MAIRYDKKLNQEIDRTIKNFNQKVARLEKEQRQLLPGKVSKKELKQSVTTRKELVNRLKELQSFSKRGAENIITTSGGAKITQYEKAKIEKEMKIQKAKLTRQINLMKVQKPKVFGKMQDVTFAEMGDQQFLNLLAKRKYLESKDIKNLTPDEIEKLKLYLQKQIEKEKTKDAQFKENYIRILNTLGYYTGYDNFKLQFIHNVLMELDTKTFTKIFNEDKSIQAILEYYPFVTGQYKGMNPEYIKDDVTELYDNLYDNMADIMQDYISENRQLDISNKIYELNKLLSELERLKNMLSYESDDDKKNEISKKIEEITDRIYKIIENA